MYGIINYSNNCYLNVILQIFINNSTCFKILKNSNLLIFKNKNIIDPIKILKLINTTFDTDEQHDAHEVLLFLIEKIPDIKDEIIGNITTKFKCTTCNDIRKSHEEFHNINIYTECLIDSIHILLEREKHMLKCDKCLKNTETIKKNRIKNFGNIIIFYNIIKVKLVISESVTYKDKKYRLTGIIKHYGNIKTGHYIYIDYINKILINDQNISNINEITGDNIYLLIFSIIV